jgi:hypothetical protein
MSAGLKKALNESFWIRFLTDSGYSTARPEGSTVGKAGDVKGVRCFMLQDSRNSTRMSHAQTSSHPARRRDLPGDGAWRQVGKGEAVALASVHPQRHEF